MTFFEKVENNAILSLKFYKISKLKSDFFQILQKKSPMFQNSANLFVLKFKCAKFQGKKNSRKNDLWSSGNLNKNFRFSNFRSEFFLIFQKKRQKTRKFHTFIYREPHLSQFWAKSEKLFSGRASGRWLIINFVESPCPLRSLTTTINSAKVYVTTTFPNYDD